MRKDTKNVCQISRVPEAVDRCRGRVRTGTRDGTVTDEEGSEMAQPGSCGGALGTEPTLLHGSWWWWDPSLTVSSSYLPSPLGH